MSLVAVGLHHRNAPLDLLEDLAATPAHIGKLLQRLTDSVDVREAAVLSTCQRIEVYADAARFHDALQHVCAVLSDHARRAQADVVAPMLTWFDDTAAAHLFATAAGLDSLVVGESEIQSQVRQAAALAESEGTIGRALRPLFRHALEASKRVRRETGIARHHASVASASVALAREVLPVAGTFVAVLGAGQAATSAARALRAAGAGEVAIVSRNEESGAALAAEVGGHRVGLDELPKILAQASVVVCSTAAPAPVITPAVVAPAMARRAGSPLVLVDIALPRDIHPDVTHVPGVTLIGLDDVRGRAEEGMSRRLAEVARGEEIVAEEVERWRLARAVRGVDPAVTALRGHAEAIAREELVRRSGRLSNLTDDDRAQVEALVRAVVRKLLHAPTAALRAHAADPDVAALVDAAAVLFDLEIE